MQKFRGVLHPLFTLGVEEGAFRAVLKIPFEIHILISQFTKFMWGRGVKVKKVVIWQEIRSFHKTASTIFCLISYFIEFKQSK